MTLRHVGEQTREERTEHARERRHQTGLLADGHEAHPQREHAGETERDFETRLGAVESRVDDGGKDAVVTRREGEKRKGHRREEKEDPDVVEYHTGHKGSHISRNNGTFGE